MLATLSTFDPKDVLPHCNKADHTLSILQWPKRVNHKSVSQNTNQFSKTQSNFLKHKSVYQNAQKFRKTQINFPKHKSVYQNAKQFLKTQTNFQNTNQFTKTQINFSKHKPISSKHKSKDWALALLLSESLERTHSQDFPRPTWRLLINNYIMSSRFL